MKDPMGALKKIIKPEEAALQAAAQNVPPMEALPNAAERTYNNIGNALGNQIGRLQDTLANAAAANPYGAQQIAAATEAQKHLNAYRDSQFNYDLYADPVYQQARDAYMRQGQLAAQDVAAQAAALTGGYGNSYGTVAAQQQYNAALQNLNDIVPQLENNAYNRWQNDQQRNLTLAQMYDDMANQAYNKQLTQAQLGAQYGDYSGLNAMNIDTSAYEAKELKEEEWQDTLRKRQTEEWTQADEDRALQYAITKANYGDYTALEDLGFHMEEYKTKEELDRAWEEEQRNRQRTEWSQADYAFMVNLAIQKAQYGDYSGLIDLGYDISSVEDEEMWKMAAQFAEYGDYRILKELGVDTTFLELQQAAKIAGLYGTGSGSGNGSRNPSSNPTPNNNPLSAAEIQQRTNEFTSLLQQAYNLTILDVSNNSDGSVRIKVCSQNRDISYYTYYPDTDKYEVEHTDEVYDPHH